MNIYLKRLKISNNVYGKYNFVETYIRYKSDNKITREKWSHYDNKLNNSISRARSEVFNILNYNKFYYFFTQTFSSKYDRTDLDLLIKKFGNVTRYLRKIHNNLDFNYLLIPEYHSDKKNWHLHGFLSKGFEVDTYINNNGFLSSHHLDKIGWNSFSKIRNYKACCLYSLEYINKNVVSDLIKGQHIYYCSRGLKRDSLVCDMVLSQIAPIHYDFKSQYVFKTSVDYEKYYNFITNIDKCKLSVLEFNQYIK